MVTMALWVGGTALIIGPVLLLTGVLLRQPFPFFFPEQLAAFQRQPALMAASYRLFAAGNFLLWPAVIRLAALIGVRKPGFAVMGGMLAMFGLFARTFHSGAFHIYSTFILAILLGWIVLEVGAYCSGILSVRRSAALSLISALPLGVLKGTTTMSLAAVIGICIALTPLGIKVLRDRPRLEWLSTMSWFTGVVALGTIFFLFGQLG